MARHPIEVKEKAIRLRREGYSVKEIANELRVAKSTSSLWIRHIVLGQRAKQRLKQQKILGYYTASLSWQRKREKDEKLLKSFAVKVANGVKKDINHQKIYCALLYWCEGGKNYNESVRFTNSDPVLVKTFLHLLRKSFSVEEHKFRVLMHIHEYHNEERQKNFWSNLTQIPRNQFNKTFLKPHTKKRIRENYPGCVAIYYHDRSFARELRAIYRAFSTILGAW